MKESDTANTSGLSVTQRWTWLRALGFDFCVCKSYTEATATQTTEKQVGAWLPSVVRIWHNYSMLV